MKANLTANMKPNSKTAMKANLTANMKANSKIAIKANLKANMGEPHGLTCVVGAKANTLFPWKPRLLQQSPYTEDIGFPMLLLPLVFVMPFLPCLSPIQDGTSKVVIQASFATPNISSAPAAAKVRSSGLPFLHSSSFGLVLLTGFGFCLYLGLGFGCWELWCFRPFALAGLFIPPPLVNFSKASVP